MPIFALSCPTFLFFDTTAARALNDFLSLVSFTKAIQITNMQFIDSSTHTSITLYQLINS